MSEPFFTPKKPAWFVNWLALHSIEAVFDAASPASWALHGLTVTYCANNNEGIASATWYITNRAGHHVMNRWVPRTQEDMLQLLEEVRGHGYFQK